MKLITVKGIKITLHYSTVFIILMVGYSAASIYFDAAGAAVTGLDLILMGIFSGLFILASIIIHELMHSLMAKKYGIKVKEIELHFFGGVSKINAEPRHPSEEFWITIVGPVSSLLLSLALFGMYYIPIAKPLFLKAFLSYNAWTNFILAAFNLIPGFPMDGGRVLRAYLWKKRGDLLSATNTASNVGKIMSFVFIGFGVVNIFLFGSLGGIWYIVLGLFLRSASEQSYQQILLQDRLSKISAEEMVNSFKITVPGELTLDKVWKDYFMKYKKGYFPVERDGTIKGIIHFDQIKNTPLEERPTTAAIKVMENIDSYNSVALQGDGVDVYRELVHDGSKEPNIVLVKDEEKNILGYIGTDEVKFILNYV